MLQFTTSLAKSCNWSKHYERLLEVKRKLVHDDDSRTYQGHKQSCQLQTAACCTNHCAALRPKPHSRSRKNVHKTPTCTHMIHKRMAKTRCPLTTADISCLNLLPNKLDLADAVNGMYWHTHVCSGSTVCCLF